MSWSTKTLVWASCASLLLHVLLLYSGSRFHLPSYKPQSQIVIQASLIKPATKSPKANISQPQKHQRKAPRNNKPKTPVEPRVTTPKDIEPPVTALTTPENATPSEATAPLQQPVENDTVSNSQTSSEASPANPAVPNVSNESSLNVMLPKDVELIFTVYKGTSGLVVGQTTYSWHMQDNMYSIKNKVEATGLFSFFYSGKLIQTSQGVVTEHGLRPIVFNIQRGKAQRIETAQFDWSEQKISLVENDNTKTLELPPGAQDQLSFIHQFPFLTPVNGIYQLTIASSRKIDHYDYEIVGEEMIETPLGVFKTLHLRKQHDANTEGTDIWLAVDRQYLPIKIQLTGKNGDVAQQIISKMSIQ